MARLICYGQRGEIRKRYREGLEEQLGAVGLVTVTLTAAKPVVSFGVLCMTINLRGLTTGTMKGNASH